MSPADGSCHFERLTELGSTRPTLIEGLPGVGMVASIAVDQITRQLGLEHYGTIDADAFPPVTAFERGRVVDAVRVYAGRDPQVMTLHSSLPIPPPAYGALSTCVLGDLATDFQRAIFLVGEPATSPEKLGTVAGFATNQAQRGELEKAGIELAQGTGLVGGPTGALLKRCHEEGVPAIALVVAAHPRRPDPGAAGAVIEEALQPLVDFHVDTSELKERDEEIQQKLQKVQNRFQQVQQQAGQGTSDQPPSGMYR